MNVYDTANKLAQEIKQSEEYANYKMAKEVLSLKPDLKKQIAEFEKIRYEVQITQMQTGVEDKEKIEKMQKLFSDLLENEDAKKFFDSETKFNILLTDVNRIIAESIKDIMQ